VLYQFGYIPKASESFDWNGYRIEVVDMDGNRIDKLLIEQLALPDPAPAEE
jgi:putative hemolysin